MWQKMCEKIPQNIFIFVRKVLIFNLATNANLLRWKCLTSDKCNLCKTKQTQLHILNNCPVAVTSGRYTWRQNSVLNTLCYYLNELTTTGYNLYVDMEGYKNPSELFNHFRPDAALVNDTEIIAVELTCCF